MESKDLLIKINNSSKGKTSFVDLDEVFVGNIDDKLGVGIVVEDEVLINEEFNRIGIQNINFTRELGGIKKQYKSVFLYTRDEVFSDKYLAICNDFVSDKNRDIIKHTPYDWFNEWATLMGNKKKDKMIYDFIGEMYTLLKLIEMGENAQWDSINKGTFDIWCENCSYEVKSSVVKSSTKISISSKFQLDRDILNHPLKLVFCRLELNNSGVSIQDLYDKLIEKGYSKYSLDKYLTESGYYVGKKSRYIKFAILETRVFSINDDFPKIVASSFKGDQFPDHIEKIDYEIDLNGLPFEKLGN